MRIRTASGICIMIIIILAGAAMGQASQSAEQYFDKQKREIEQKIAASKKAEDIKKDISNLKIIIDDLTKKLAAEKDAEKKKVIQKDLDAAPGMIKEREEQLKKLGPIGDINSLNELLKKYDSYTPVEKDYEFYKDVLYLQRANELASAEAKAKSNPTPENKQAVIIAQNNLKTTQASMIDAEKKARDARLRRQINVAGEIDTLTNDIKTMEEKAKALSDRKDLTDEEKKQLAEYRSQIASKTNKIAALLDQKKRAEAMIAYYNGERTIAQTLTEVIEAYNEFSGLGALSSLFISDSDLAKKRQEANDLFCSTLLLGGTQCWTSKLCQYSVDASPGGLGLVARGAAQQPIASAHIEADKSLPITYTNLSSQQTVSMRLYRITYYLHNAGNTNLTWNMAFYATDGTEYFAFPNDQLLGEGETNKRMRTQAITQYSNKDYTKVCLYFDPPIKRFGGGEAKELCNDIKEYGGAATSMTQSTATTSSTSTSGTTAGTAFGGF